jgi:hypothetical protein
MLKSALAEKSKGKWRFLFSSFPSDAANQIRSSALLYLRGRFFNKGIKSYLGVLEDPPYLSLHFGSSPKDAPAPWLRTWAKDGYSVLPLSKEPKEVTPHGFRSLTLSQVQRIDDGRALMQIEVRDTFGKDYGFLDVIGDMSHWAFLLATKRGKTWTFETRAWSYFPLE